MQLRAYSSDDFEAVIQLWWDAWHSSSGYRHPKSIDEWKRRWLDLESSHDIVVIEHQNTVIAFAALNAQACVLSQIFVSPNWKRKGIGTQLMHWVNSQCPCGFTLKTAADNPESKAFYETLGMVETSQSVNDFNGREEIEYST